MATHKMTILQASILFKRFANMYDQVKQIIVEGVGTSEEKNKIKRLNNEMEILFRLPNTKDNRDRMQKLILDYGQWVYELSTRSSFDEDFQDYYQLKED